MIDQNEEQDQDIQDRMRESVWAPVGAFRQTPEIDRLASALVKAQANIKPAERNVMNPHFKHRYADLAAVMGAVMPHLSAAGLCVIQGPGIKFDGGDVVVTMTTRLMHEAGQWIENEFCAIARAGGPQEIGSTITYLKRYGLSALVGCVADDDDDGEGAYGRDRDSSRGQDEAPGKKQGKPVSVKKLSKKDVDAIVAAFSKFNVKLEKLEEKLEKKAADWGNPERLRLLGVHKALEGGAVLEDEFGEEIEEPKAKAQRTPPMEEDQEPGSNG